MVVKEDLVDILTKEMQNLKLQMVASQEEVKELVNTKIVAINTQQQPIQATASLYPPASSGYGQGSSYRGVQRGGYMRSGQALLSLGPVVNANTIGFIKEEQYQDSYRNINVNAAYIEQ